jgi:hypothetical protein
MRDPGQKGVKAQDKAHAAKIAGDPPAPLFKTYRGKQERDNEEQQPAAAQPKREVVYLGLLRWAEI